MIIHLVAAVKHSFLVEVPLGGVDRDGDGTTEGDCLQQPGQGIRKEEEQGTLLLILLEISSPALLWTNPGTKAMPKQPPSACFPGPLSPLHIHPMLLLLDLQQDLLLLLLLLSMEGGQGEGGGVNAPP